MTETMANEVRKQTYPNHRGLDSIDIVSDPDDEDLRIDLSVAEEDFIYLSRNQVRCLMHQLTDWMAGY
jgi:hypothetical protein